MADKKYPDLNRMKELLSGLKGKISRIGSRAGESLKAAAGRIGIKNAQADAAVQPSPGITRTPEEEAMLLDDPVLVARKEKMEESVRARRVKMKYFRAAAALAGGVVLLYLLFTMYYAFHFLPKTSVNGVNVSGMNAKKAEQALEAAAGDYTLTVTGADGKTETISGSGLNITIREPKDIRKAIRKQNPFLWMTGDLFQKNITSAIRTSYDKSALLKQVQALHAFDSSSMISPVDAALQEQDDGSMVITRETVGTTIDLDKAYAQIQKAVGTYLPAVDLADSQVLPEVTADDASLKKRMKEWNNLLKAAGLSYNFPKETVTLSSKDIAGLLYDDGKSVSVSYDLVATLLSSWKDEYDTYKNSFEFTTALGTTVKMLPYGEVGWELNEEDTAKALIEAIENGDTGNHDPSFYHKTDTMSNMGLGDTYVEVSIKDQYLWIHKNGEIVLESSVVTGNPNPDDEGKNRETYPGVWDIDGKYKDVTLGTIEVQGYASPVSYWVPFNGGEGLHDAPWRTEFGGTIYKTNGSHGCVNCPEDVMGAIFSNVEKGELVIIY
jgi:hypothetical protein